MGVGDIRVQRRRTTYVPRRQDGNNYEKSNGEREMKREWGNFACLRPSPTYGT